LHSIPLGSKFNVISFGTNFEKLFHTSKLYNQQSLNQAVDKIKDFQASMGGTKILEPMNEIFSWPLDEKLPRQIYLLTDGEVENT
jgi:von Willebrand factor A domain-containing protein 5